MTVKYGTMLNRLTSAGVSPCVLAIAISLVANCQSRLMAAQFQPVAGPYEGTVAGFAVDGGGIVYVVGDGSGVFQSTDPTGTNWTVFGDNANLPDTVLQSIGIDSSTTPPTLYVGSQVGTMSGSAALYRSVDGGHTWTWFNNGLPAASPYGFAYKSSTGDMFAALFAGAGLYRLPAGSTNWIACATGLSNALATAVLVNPSNGDVYFFNYGDGKIYRSTNNGAAFASATIESGNQQIFSIAIDSSALPPYLYAVADNVLSGGGCGLQTTGGIYRSIDSGATWQVVGAASLPAFPSGVSSVATDSNGRVYAGVANSVSGPGGLYVSSDHGQTFSQIVSPVLADTDGPTRIFVQGTGTIYLGADGVYRGASADNGQTWNWQHLTSANGLLLTQNGASISFDSDGSIYVGSTGQGVSVSRDFGATWKHVNGSGTNRLGSLNVETVFVEPHTHCVYAMVGRCLPEALWRSTNQGVSWAAVSGYSTSYYGIGVNAAVNTTNGVYNIVAGCKWGGPMGPWVSTDGGNSAHQAVIPNGTPGCWVGRPGVNPVTGDIYAGCELNGVGVLKSTDNGLSFQETDTNNGDMGNNYCIGFSHDGKIVFDGADSPPVGGPKVTFDAGAHWNFLYDYSTGIQQYSGVACWASDASNCVYAGGSSLAPSSSGGYTAGLLRGLSTNGGTNWTWLPCTNGLPNYIGVEALAVNNMDGNLYVGVNGGRGLYRSVSPVQTPAAATPVMLNIAPAGTPFQYSLSYVGPPGYPLQSSPSLGSPPVWTALSNIAWATNGATNTALVATNGARLFFRLAK